MGRIAKAIKIAHCRPRYHLTGGPVLSPVAAGEPVHRLVSSFEHTKDLWALDNDELNQALHEHLETGA